jgi:hypothetical protein
VGCLVGFALGREFNRQPTLIDLGGTCDPKHSPVVVDRDGNFWNCIPADPRSQWKLMSQRLEPK